MAIAPFSKLTNHSKRNLWRLAIAFFLIFTLTSCTNRSQVEVLELPEVPIITEPRQLASGAKGTLTEVAPPAVLLDLNELIADKKPNLHIASPQTDQVMEKTALNVDLRLKGLSIYRDASTGLGPYVQLSVDNQPAQAVYDLDEPITFEDLAPGTHTIRAIALKPWGESFKNPEAFDEVTFHVFAPTQENAPNKERPELIYNQPQGTYSAEPILLDFYLNNAPLRLLTEEGDTTSNWKIRCTINGQSFFFEQWHPIYLRGFKPGENWIQLTLTDAEGKPLPNAFNSTVRIIDYDPSQQTMLSQLMRGELPLRDVGQIVNPNYIPPAVPEPVIETEQAEGDNEEEKINNEEQTIEGETVEPENEQETIDTEKAIDTEKTEDGSEDREEQLERSQLEQTQTSKDKEPTALPVDSTSLDNLSDENEEDGLDKNLIQDTQESTEIQKQVERRRVEEEKDEKDREEGSAGEESIEERSIEEDPEKDALEEIEVELTQDPNLQDFDTFSREETVEEANESATDSSASSEVQTTDDSAFPTLEVQSPEANSDTFKEDSSGIEVVQPNEPSVETAAPNAIEDEQGLTDSENGTEYSNVEATPVDERSYPAQESSEKQEDTENVAEENIAEENIAEENVAEDESVAEESAESSVEEAIATPSEQSNFFEKIQRFFKQASPTTSTESKDTVSTQETDTSAQLNPDSEVGLPATSSDLDSTESTEPDIFKDELGANESEIKQETSKNTPDSDALIEDSDEALDANQTDIREADKNNTDLDESSALVKEDRAIRSEEPDAIRNKLTDERTRSFSDLESDLDFDDSSADDLNVAPYEPLPETLTAPREASSV